MKNVLAWALALPLVAAYPEILKSHTNVKRRAPTYESGRSNTGIIKSTDFDAKEQYVDVSDGGAHAFQAPTASDLRGE